MQGKKISLETNSVNLEGGTKIVNARNPTIRKFHWVASSTLRRT